MQCYLETHHPCMALVIYYFVLFKTIKCLTLYAFFSDQIRDWSQVRLPSVLCAARLPAQRGEEADKQREQGSGHRLQRLQAHLLRLSVPGKREHHKLTLRSLIIASKEAQ